MLKMVRLFFAAAAVAAAITAAAAVAIAASIVTWPWIQAGVNPPPVIKCPVLLHAFVVLFIMESIYKHCNETFGKVVGVSPFEDDMAVICLGGKNGLNWFSWVAGVKMIRIVSHTVVKIIVKFVVLHRSIANIIGQSKCIC